MSVLGVRGKHFSRKTCGGRITREARPCIPQLGGVDCDELLKRGPRACYLYGRLSPTTEIPVVSIVVDAGGS